MGIDHFAFLARNTLLRGLTEAQLQKVGGMARSRTFSRGETLIGGSESPDTIYLIADGRVEVRGGLPGVGPVGVAELAAGEFCGEAALVAGAAGNTVEVVALTKVEALALDAKGFAGLLEEQPGMMRGVLSNIIQRLQGVNNGLREAVRTEKDQLERVVLERTRELEAVGQRVRRELMLAQIIQRNLLPEKRKSYSGLTVATDYIPCTELGGDITGVFQIDETRLGVYGGDVCGHGIYAAMVMSYVKKLIETSVKRVLLKRQYVVKPPGAVLTTINQSFISEISQGDPEIYLTLFLGVLDMRTLTMEYSSAGTHCPPLVLSGGEARLLFTQSDFSIGHVPNHEYATSRHTFARGDVFLFVSDGVIEARRGEELFGMERLRRDAARLYSETGSLDADAVVRSVRSFLGEEPPQDDMCLLTIEFTGEDEPLS